MCVGCRHVEALRLSGYGDSSDVYVANFMSIDDSSSTEVEQQPSRRKSKRFKSQVRAKAPKKQKTEVNPPTLRLCFP